MPCPFTKGIKYCDMDISWDDLKLVLDHSHHEPAQAIAVIPDLVNRGITLLQHLWTLPAPDLEIRELVHEIISRAVKEIRHEPFNDLSR
jgi:hypothetical protein